MKSLELIEVGHELGLILPEELHTTLHVGLLDDVELTPVGGGFILHSHSSEARFFLQRYEERANEPERSSYRRVGA